MKVICPFCHEEVKGEDVPSYGTTAFGKNHVCHKKICYNKDKHPDHNNIAVIFTPVNQEK